MKKKNLIIVLGIFLGISFITLAFFRAAVSSAQNADQAQINDLTNRIASRVAQLKLVEKRGILGKVTDVSNTQLTLTDIHGDTRFVDVDEFTNFPSASSKKTSFGISDITKDETLGVLGLYNKDSQRILARFVDVLTLPQFVHGYIASIDAKNFILTVVTDDGAVLNIDVETTTSTLAYAGSAELTKSGFSKLKEDENIVVAGFYDLKNKNEIIASKIIAFADIPRNPKIKAPVISPTPTSATQKKQSLPSY